MIKLASLTKKTWTKKIRPVRIKGELAFITLTRGKVAIIDASDVPLVSGWNWSAKPDKSEKIWYAVLGGSRKISLHVHLLGRKRGFKIDHKDRDGLNCRRSNLRHVTDVQSCWNRGNRSDGKSAFKGVGKHGNNWRARIVINGARTIVGTFKTEVEAARAYNAAAKNAFWEYAVLNSV